MRIRSRLIVVLSLLLAGCGRDHADRPPRAASRADSGSVADDRPMDAALPPAHMDSLAAPPLTALRIAPPPPGEGMPPPDAPPTEPPPSTEPVDRLTVDEGLRPPVLRTAARWPIGSHAHGWVEVDVLVDPHGDVAQVRPAAGNGDTATVRAAVQAARSLRYYPARRAGRPVAVWCRQRFDSGR